MTLKEAALRLERTDTTVSRMEADYMEVRHRDVTDLLDFYGVPEDAPVRGELRDLVRDAKKQGWWRPYSDVTLKNFDAYIGLEAGASAVRSYEVKVIPGLLQTEDYARALLSTNRELGSPDNIDRMVELRMIRQKNLTSDPPLQLSAIVDEAALHSRVGGVEVLRAQLHHLIEASAAPNVILQVIPASAGAHSGMGFPFHILEFSDDPLDTDIVYLDYWMGSLYLEKPRDIRTYTRMLQDLHTVALPPDDSVHLIKRIAEGL
jgi:hypothetical protein